MSDETDDLGDAEKVNYVITEWDEDDEEWEVVDFGKPFDELVSDVVDQFWTDKKSGPEGT